MILHSGGMQMSKIGVFDSGVGGKSVANALESALPEHQVLFRNDVEHVPYATRTPEEIKGFVVPILQSLATDGCDVIVVACNTVSTTLIEELRAIISVPLVAVEPMVKPAVALTKTKVIAVCATPTTLASPRYAWLKQEYAEGITVIEPDCSNWSYLIENNLINRQHIDTGLESALQAGADVIVLGCTHYHWIEEEIKAAVGNKATVVQPEAAVVRQVERLLTGIEPRA